jgi:antirestriction protein ArdC
MMFYRLLPDKAADKRFYPREADLPTHSADGRIDRAETFFAGTGATIRHGGTMAFYNVSQDFVQMPPFESFRDAESFYATLAHETTHWTRHPSRLDRDFGRKRFGDEGDAMEELVAELGSAFLSPDLDLTPDVREDHASYIASWIKVLKDDKRAIFTAASHAQRAADSLNRSCRPTTRLRNSKLPMSDKPLPEVGESGRRADSALL